MEVMAVNDVVKCDWGFGENVKISWMGLSKFTSDVKSIDEFGCSAYHLILETVKYLISGWMLEVPGEIEINI